MGPLEHSLLSVYAKANELSLNLCRKKICIQNYLKLESNSGNVMQIVDLEPLYKDAFQKKEKAIPKFSIQCEDTDFLNLI